MCGIPIKVDGGAPIFVRDVATVKDAAQIQTNVVRIDGRRQVYIPIYRQPGANTIAVVDGIKQQLGAIKQRLPQDVNLDVVMDQSVYVRTSIEQLEARRRDRSAAMGRVAAPSVEAFYQEGLTGDRVGDVAPLRRSGVAVTWNISASGVERIQSAVERIEEASLALAQAEQGVRADVMGAWTNLQAALARLDRARQARTSADATLRISQVRFRNGTRVTGTGHAR